MSNEQCNAELFLQLRIKQFFFNSRIRILLSLLVIIILHDYVINNYNKIIALLLRLNPFK